MKTPSLKIENSQSRINFNYSNFTINQLAQLTEFNPMLIKRIVESKLPNVTVCENTLINNNIWDSINEMVVNKLLLIKKRDIHQEIKTTHRKLKKKSISSNNRYFGGNFFKIIYIGKIN